MKIIACGQQDTIISIPTEILSELIGRIGDSHYASYKIHEMEGREFDLGPFIRAAREMKVMCEVKNRVLEGLKDIESRIPKFFWPVQEIKEIEPKPKEKKK